ncbi:hypothetical protein COLO4_23995 [Corchorus olitorius]|uniref:Uncharacterized protein n=1 Tax=Corchorus olitorius TaxID=93759 RepID=A0A1R3IDM6_9ROSI|nr:hypothetical protein COLO4_23995 [Corchorus olitorius]
MAPNNRHRPGSNPSRPIQPHVPRNFKPTFQQSQNPRFNPHRPGRDNRPHATMVEKDMNPSELIREQTLNLASSQAKIAEPTPSPVLLAAHEIVFEDRADAPYKIPPFTIESSQSFETWWLSRWAGAIEDTGEIIAARLAPPTGKKKNKAKRATPAPEEDEGTTQAAKKKEKSPRPLVPALLLESLLVAKAKRSLDFGDDEDNMEADTQDGAVIYNATTTLTQDASDNSTLTPNNPGGHTKALEATPMPQIEKDNANLSDDEIMVQIKVQYQGGLAAISRCNFLKTLVSKALPPSNDFSPDREPEVPSRIDLEIALGTVRSFLSNVYEGVAEKNMELIFDAARTLYLAPQLTPKEAQFWRHFQQTFESFIADFHHTDGNHDHLWMRKILLEKDASKTLGMTNLSHNELSFQRRLIALETEAAKVRAEFADLADKRLKAVLAICDLIEKETKEHIASRKEYVQANRDHDFADLQLSRKEAEFYAWRFNFPLQM